MPIIPALSGTRSSGGLIRASWDDADFTNIRDTVNTYCLFTDVNRTVTANLTFTPTSGVGITVSSGGLTVTAGGITVSANGITVTGNSTITGTLGGVTTLTCTTLAATSINALTSIELTGTGVDTLIFSGASPRLQLPSTTLGLYDSTTQRHFIEAGGDFVIGANSVFATTDTDGFLVLPRMNGVATGVPSYTGTIVYDATNNKIGVYDGGWLWTAALT